jgi:hypothetical protein
MRVMTRRMEDPEWPIGSASLNVVRADEVRTGTW